MSTFFNFQDQLRWGEKQNLHEIEDLVLSKHWDTEHEGPIRDERRSWLHDKCGIYKYSGKLSLPQSSMGNLMENMPLAELFQIAMASAQGKLDSLEADSLLACAARGYLPAQAIFEGVCAAKARPLPAELMSQIERWRFNSVASGYLFSRWSIEESRPASYYHARNLFRNCGGYNLHYCGQSLAYLDASQPDHGERVSGLVGSLEKDLEDYPFHLAAALDQLTSHDFKNLSSPKELDLQLQDKWGDTALIKCCMAGHISTLQVLVHSGADASVQNPIFGYTAAHWLFTFDDSSIDEAANLLSRAGADNTVANKEVLNAFHLPLGWPCGAPLHWAVFANNKAAVEAIVKHGGNISQLDFQGQTALHIALKMLNVSMVELLISLGANLGAIQYADEIDYYSSDASSRTSSVFWMNTPLQTPVHDFLANSLRLGNSDDPGAKLRYFADEFIPQYYDSALFTHGNHTLRARQTLDLVLTYEPNCLTWTDCNGDTPLHYACDAAWVEPVIIDLLLERGPGFQEISETQRSALNGLFANHDVALDDAAMSDLLKREMLDIDAKIRQDFLNRCDPFIESLFSMRSYTHYRPVHFAAELGLYQCLKVLIDLGVDQFLTTELENLSALDMASQAVEIETKVKASNGEFG